MAHAAVSSAHVAYSVDVDLTLGLNPPRVPPLFRSSHSAPCLCDRRGSFCNRRGCLAANRGGSGTYGAHNPLAGGDQDAAAAGMAAMTEVVFDRGASRGFSEWNSENYWMLARA